MRRWRDDEGSVLVLAAGLVVVALLVLVVVADASAMFLSRRSLAATADGAALAGAQGADLARVYAGGTRGHLPLDRRAVLSRVRDYLTTAPDARLVSVRTDGTTVTVRVSTRVRPPFRSWLGEAGTVVVVAEARASTPVR